MTDTKANELKYKSFDDMPPRVMFGPEEIENGTLGTYMEKLQELKPENVELIVSDAETPEGWGVAVVTVAETKPVTDEAGTVTRQRIPTRVIVWPMPTVEVLTSDAQGFMFIAAAVQKEMAHQLARPFRDSSVAADDAKREAPLSIADYATRRAAESQFKVYNELATAAINMVKDAAPNHPFAKRLTKPMLREVLESAAAARAMAPDLEEAKLWDSILVVLAKFAEKQEMSSQIFLDWAAKRHNVETLNLGAIDLSALVMGGDDDEGDDE